MPYIPRSSALDLPSLESAPRAPSRATSEKPSIPYTEASSTNKVNPLIGRLNMLKFDVPALSILNHITGKEFKIDGYARLVPPERTSS